MTSGIPIQRKPDMPTRLMAQQMMVERVLANKVRAKLLGVDAVSFIQGKLGEHLWSKQREIAEAIQQHRHVAVHSAHGTGKSWLAARLISWWIESHQHGEAFALSTAPTYHQVRAILWRELNRAHRVGRLSGAMNQVDWSINGELVALGRKPGDYDEDAFQGIHSKYVLVVIDEACHDDKTEVMTEYGWKLFSEVVGTEKLLTMDPVTHKARYTHPRKIVRKKYSGRMIEYSSMGANYCVTPDHDMFYHGRSHNKDTFWRKGSAKKLASLYNKYMKKHIEWDGVDNKVYTIPSFMSDRKIFPAKDVPMDLWMAFLGWYCSEGSLLKNRGRVTGVAISQKNKKNYDRIYSLCELLEFNPYACKHSVRVGNMQIGAHLAQLGENCLEKRIPIYAKMACKRQLNLFLDSFVAGDGYKKGKGEVLYTSSPGMADDLQEMILKTGVQSVLRRRNLQGVVAKFKTHTSASSVDGYVITRPYKTTKIKSYPDNFKELDYDGMVYCAHVPPDNLLFTRRNGYTLWSGNCGIPEQLWTAADAIITNEYSRILAIGNPDDPTSHFARICGPGSGWHTIGVSVFDSPNFTGEQIPDELHDLLVSQTWVDEREREWGKDDPRYVAKVEGRFPEDLEHGVIPYSWVRECQKGIENLDELPVELGFDVSAGGDEAVIWERRGMKATRRWGYHEPDTMVLTGHVVKIIRETGATCVKIDRIGVGQGVYDRLTEIARQDPTLKGVKIIGVCVADASSKPSEYPKLRDEIWFMGRSLCEDGVWDLSSVDDKVVSELIAPTWKPDSAGRSQVEPKKETKKRIGRSPDDADALLLAFYKPPAKRVRIAGIG